MEPNPWLRPHRPLVIAHRGHSIAVPENTMNSYRRAIELGADMIEADVHLTRGGQLFMLHDDTLDRTTTGRGPAREATWDEIQALDAGSWMGPEFIGLRVPRTQELMDMAAEAGILLCLEVKGADAAEAEAIAAALARELVARDALGSVFVAAYHHRALAVAREIAPDVMLAPERLPDDLPPDPPEAIRQARALAAPVLHHQHTCIDRDLVRALHAAGIAVWSWTVNREDDVARSLELGVDGVLGDDVAVLVATRDRLRVRAASPVLAKS
jgi:glycerophosphoryl diester phosphodiesterase